MMLDSLIFNVFVQFENLSIYSLQYSIVSMSNCMKSEYYYHITCTNDTFNFNARSHNILSHNSPYFVDS